MIYEQCIFFIPVRISAWKLLQLNAIIAHITNHECENMLQTAPIRMKPHLLAKTQVGIPKSVQFSGIFFFLNIESDSLPHMVADRILAKLHAVTLSEQV